MKLKSVNRIRLLAFVIFLVSALLMSRLFFLQVVRGEHYAEMGDRQYLRPATNLFDRGNIYFSEKSGRKVSAATIKQGFLLAVNPTKVKDAAGAYEKINAIYPIDREMFIRRATKPNDPYEEIANRLDQEVADQIKGLELPGVYLIREKWRFYPAGRLAAHTLGLIGYQGDRVGGLYGLEKQYESILSREAGLSFVNFFAEIFSGLASKISLKENKSRGDIILTIDPIAQVYLEGQLKETSERWRADAAGGIIMDPRTGEIIAMAALPNFDPGERQSHLGSLPNPLVERVYEMGSVIKPLTIAAGLDAGVIKADTTYNDVGYVILNTARIQNHDKRSSGVVTMQEALNKSLNTGMINIMQRLGRDNFRQYMLGYGIGQKTGIDLPDEVPGLVRNLQSTRDVEYATASFGQGLALTPIGLIRALSVLANGGLLVEPHVVKKIEYETKLDQEIKPKVGKRVIKEETSVEISRMLTVAVDQALQGGRHSLPRHTIAAKTGTAQMAREGGGGYYSDRYLHSFFGYVPAYDARYITLLYVIHPKGAPYASDTLTEPFMNITKFLINYYEIPPDR
jgi:stage V sporulation protein D (sporulation-specific penicillin-binding protein)